MSIKRLIYLILFIYSFQLLILPLSHYEHESNEEYRCVSCPSGEQLNSSCGDQNVPCENPAHHHHKSQTHDPAQCLACKSFMADAENCDSNRTSACTHSFYISYCNEDHVIFHLSFSAPIRAPPVQIS